MVPESVILVLRGQSEDTETITRLLADRCRVIEADSISEAANRLSDDISLVLVEVGSPDSETLQLVRECKSRQPQTPVLAVTGEGDVTSAVEAMKLGAADCVAKPVNPDELQATASRLLAEREQDTPSDRSDRHSGREQRRQIDIPPGTSLEDLERAAVEQALSEHQGNRTHAAKTLGISVRTLQRKLKAWGMPVTGGQNSMTSGQFFVPTHGGQANQSAYSTHAG